MSTPELNVHVARASEASFAERGAQLPASAEIGWSEKIRSGWQPALVWMVWLVMTMNALRFIVRYGSRSLFLDDMWLVQPSFDPHGLTWAMLWLPHNEHREPLPQLLQYVLFRATGDVRSGLWLIVIVLSGVALASIVLARKMRGRLTWTDALFPVLWLQTGNAENLQMGYQISLMLPTALVALVTMWIATAPDGLRPKAAAACAISIVCLPLCGGPGFLQAPVLSLWAFVTGRALRKSADAERRRSGTLLTASAAITTALLVLYLVGYESPPGTARTYTFAAIGELTLNVLGLALGPAAETWKPWVGAGVMLFGSTGLALALRAWKTTPSERRRAFGISSCLTANACVALGIGFGRSGHGGQHAFPIRYVLLTAPLVCAAYVAWTLYGSRTLSSIVRAAACAVSTCAFLFVGCAAGERMGAQRREVMDALERDIAADVPAPEIIDRYNDWLDGEPHRLFTACSQMAELRMPPFDRASEAEIRAFGQVAEGVTPSRAEGLVMPAPKERGLLLARGSLIVFDVPDTATKMKGEFVFPSTDDESLRGRSARFFVTMSHTQFKQREVLLTRAIDPTAPASERTDQVFELPLQPHDHRQVALQFIMPLEANGKILYGRVVEVRFE
jgi:hypothetical protein